MSGGQLKNKPLVEAIFEIRWKLGASPQGAKQDPHYKLLLGRFFDRVQDDYPFHEPLPASNVPDELVGHIVQHRFRTGKEQWPLVQLGPGIMSVNATADYLWDDFRERTISAVAKLYESHPATDEFCAEGLLLRYIDGVAHDYEQSDVLQFLREKMQVQASLPESLFAQRGIQERPSHLNWQASFASAEPAGRVHLRFATGQRSGAPELIWETSVQSLGDDIPEIPEEFPVWLDGAHEITHDWFFKLIEGELHRRFSGE